jgi:hypothetical protein
LEERGTDPDVRNIASNGEDIESYDRRHECDEKHELLVSKSAPLAQAKERRKL